MSLSSAEKQRRYRERKKAEREARSRYDRGLPPLPPEPEVPDGAAMTSNGLLHAQFGHYEALDGSFKPVPEDIMHEGWTSWRMRCEARRREGEAPVSDDRSILFGG